MNTDACRLPSLQRRLVMTTLASNEGRLAVIARCHAGSSSLSRCQECHCLPLSMAACSAPEGAGALCGRLLSLEHPFASTPRHLHSSTGPAWYRNTQALLPCLAAAPAQHSASRPAQPLCMETPHGPDEHSALQHIAKAVSRAPDHWLWPSESAHRAFQPRGQAEVPFHVEPLGPLPATLQAPTAGAKAPGIRRYLCHWS